MAGRTCRDGSGKTKQRKDFRGSIVGDHGTSFFAFRERSDLCPDVAQRGLSLKIGDFGVKAGIGL